MNVISKLISAGVVAVTLFSLSGTARADALPEDACDSTQVGEVCSNAGPDFNQSGVCEQDKCTTTKPDGDGGFTTTTSNCTHCVNPNSGDGGTKTTGDGGSTTTTTTNSNSSSGCSATPDSRDGGTAIAMLALGVAGLVIGRRKRA